MRKMGNIALELEERAQELGQPSLGDALANGYTWKLKLTADGHYKPDLWLKDEETLAHESLLKEREDIVTGLYSIIRNKKLDDCDRLKVEKAVKFIQENVL